MKNDPPSKSEIRQGMDYLWRHAKVRFYADENFPFLATRMLRHFGAQVVTVQEADLRRHPDENQTAYALRYRINLPLIEEIHSDGPLSPLRLSPPAQIPFRHQMISFSSAVLDASCHLYGKIFLLPVRSFR